MVLTRASAVPWADTGSQDLLCLQWDEKVPGHTRPQMLDWEGGG